MKVLILSPYPALLHPALEHTGDTYVDCSEPPSKWPVGCDYLVSFGYRYIIRQPYLQQFPNSAINIHISVLPWNRGADPNFWSWFDDTPKGVSIHRIDTGIDTGEVLEQWHCTKWIKDETLRSSWTHLIATAKELFERRWHLLRVDALKARAVQTGGSYHKSNDKLPFITLMPQKWDTPVREVERMGREYREQHGLQDCGAWLR